jgi:hypothetical protein
MDNSLVWKKEGMLELYFYAVIYNFRETQKKNKKNPKFVNIIFQRKNFQKSYQTLRHYTFKPHEIKLFLISHPPLFSLFTIKFVIFYINKFIFKF